MTTDGSVLAAGIRFFVNSIETSYAQGTDGVGALNDDATIPIGINCVLVPMNLHATFDDVRIYDRALSPVDISALAAQ